MDRCCKNNTDMSMQSKVIEPTMFKIQAKKNSVGPQILQGQLTTSPLPRMT